MILNIFSDCNYYKSKILHVKELSNSGRSGWTSEQSETNTFVVSSLAESAVTELYRSKSVDKDPAHWSATSIAYSQVLTLMCTRDIRLQLVVWTTLALCSRHHTSIISGLHVF